MSCSTKACSTTEKCTFVQVAVPSRADVPAYEDEREEVEALIARINGKHPRANGSVPVIYMDTSLDEVEVAAWFRAANALVVTSLADGMNLVAKEFVAARGDLQGALVLSEFAGAAQDLDGALIVNPYDIEAIKRSLVAAIEMPAVERAARLKSMRAAVQHNDVHRWARNFLHSVARVSACALQRSGVAHRLGECRWFGDRPEPPVVAGTEETASWTSPSSPRPGCLCRHLHTAERKRCSTSLPAGCRPPVMRSC